HNLAIFNYFLHIFCEEDRRPLLASALFPALASCCWLSAYKRSKYPPVHLVAVGFLPQTPKRSSRNGSTCSEGLLPISKAAYATWPPARCSKVHRPDRARTHQACSRMQAVWPTSSCSFCRR